MNAIDHRLTVKERIEVLRWIMDNPMGRKFVWWLLGECQIFVNALGEHHMMAYQSGKRHVGLKLFELIQSDNTCWNLFAKARDEHDLRKQQTTEKE